MENWFEWNELDTQNLLIAQMSKALTKGMSYDVLCSAFYFSKPCHITGYKSDRTSIRKFWIRQLQSRCQTIPVSLKTISLPTHTLLMPSTVAKADCPTYTFSLLYLLVTLVNGGAIFIVMRNGKGGRLVESSHRIPSITAHSV